MQMLRWMLVGMLCCLLETVSQGASPPPPPVSGPGSTGDTTQEVIKRTLGDHGAVVYAFYAENREGPKPVVVFLHPWGANEPYYYGGWFSQLARKGFVVLFPKYQEVNVTLSTQAGLRVVDLLETALKELRNDPHAQIDHARVAYVGHLAGAAVAMNLAADASNPLPPQLIFALMPGGIAQNERDGGIPLADLSDIPGNVNIAALTADKASTVTDKVARRLLNETTQVPLERKLYIKVFSDAHGFPTLSASPASPGCADDYYSADELDPPRGGVQPIEDVMVPNSGRNKKRPAPQRKAPPHRLALVSGEQKTVVRQIGNNKADTLDYYVYWKSLEMMANIAFAGGDISILQKDPQFIGVGVWSDGFPVKRLWVELPKPE
ncbi:MAG: alpha/beta hydrolase [Methylobacteriaceae bacterium]|jgi:dienelactone hydrolase|nr:alpha/beta hydrolase [Methylobacteriaceae bacterium]